MPITSAQAQEARRNIASVALQTPLVRCNADAPANLYLKLENLQPIGSFKIRGAANVMARTPRERLTRGVLTASAGNMAQGVAFCAQRIGVGATIIAPDTAPATKIRAVERMGGRVIKVPFAESLRPECVSMPPRLKLRLRWLHRLLPVSRKQSNISHRSSMVSAARQYSPACSNWRASCWMDRW